MKIATERCVFGMLISSDLLAVFFRIVFSEFLTEELAFHKPHQVRLSVQAFLDLGLLSVHIVCGTHRQCRRTISISQQKKPNLIFFMFCEN